jgi:O-antigen ligase
LAFVALVAAYSLVGAIGSVLVTLPFFYYPLQFGGLELAASELLLGGTLAGFGLTAAIGVARDPSRGMAHLGAMIGRAARAPAVVVLAVLALDGLLLLWFLTSGEPRAAGLREWRWTLVEPLLLVGLLATVQLSSRDREVLVGCFLAGGVLAALLALGQFVAGEGVSADGLRRVDGPWPHPNALALYLTRPLVLVAALMALGPSARRFLWPILAVTGLAVVGSFSRGAMAALAVAALTLSLLLPRRERLVVLTGTLAGVLAIAFIARERLVNIFAGGSGSLRLDIWRSAVEMIRDRPVTGYGPDQFFYTYTPRYVRPAAWDERFTSHAHNLVADFWIRLGIIGAVFALLGVGIVIFLTVRRLRNTGQVSYLTVAATLTLGVALIQALVDNAYFAHDLAMSLWFIVWLAFAATNRTERSEGTSARANTHRRRRGVDRVTPM